VYWDFKLNNNSGGWSDYGCILISTNNNTVFTCSCNHTTNFAVLFVSITEFIDLIFELKIYLKKRVIQLIFVHGVILLYQLSQ
jgi:serine kinase of HPr protein (carbohydrate metabolism regulator)